MKFTAIRRYIKNRNLQKPHLLQNCDLVVDATCFFKDSYKNSGCQFILGADCDTYAKYLVTKIEPFKTCNINCYFIFKGTRNDNVETRLSKQQNIVDDLGNIDIDSPTYFEPLLTCDVQKQTLEIMRINYFCCEYDSIETLVGVARQYKCPILTDKIEYCLFGVSCILPNVVYKETHEVLECILYDRNIYRSVIGLYDKTPILLALLNDGVDYINKLPELSNCLEKYYISAIFRWIRRNDLESVTMNLKDENDKKAFIDLYTKIKILYLYPSCNLGVNYFRRTKPFGLFKDDKKWFSKGVSNGRIAVPYIDIKRKGFVTGSTVVNDKNKPDALLAASKIIAYSRSLLTNSQNATLNFIGRKHSDCSIWEINIRWENKVNNRDIFTFKKKKSDINLFRLFFKEVLPEFDVTTLVKMLSLPKDCHIIVITLVYYIRNVNKEFIDGAYFILLSYLILGPVSTKIYNCKQSFGSISDSDKTIYTSCKTMYDGLKFLFRQVDLRQHYDPSILHSLAEFQHCLQHINYLNTLCGTVLSGTMYQDALNMTFVYNMYVHMKNKDHLLSYLESNFHETWALDVYKSITNGFEQCCYPSEAIQSEYTYNDSDMKSELLGYLNTL